MPCRLLLQCHHSMESCHLEPLAIGGLLCMIHATLKPSLVIRRKRYGNTSISHAMSNQQLWEQSWRKGSACRLVNLWIFLCEPHLWCAWLCSWGGRMALILGASDKVDLNYTKEHEGLSNAEYYFRSRAKKIRPCWWGFDFFGAFKAAKGARQVYVQYIRGGRSNASSALQWDSAKTASSCQPLTGNAVCTGQSSCHESRQLHKQGGNWSFEAAKQHQRD